MLERSPLKRMATAEDISAAAAFLCSPAARNISGQVLPVNAGEPACENLLHCAAHQLLCHDFGTLQFAFVFQFKLSRHGG